MRQISAIDNCRSIVGQDVDAEADAVTALAAKRSSTGHANDVVIVMCVDRNQADNRAADMAEFSIGFVIGNVDTD